MARLEVLVRSLFYVDLKNIKRIFDQDTTGKVSSYSYITSHFMTMHIIEAISQKPLPSQHHLSWPRRKVNKVGKID
jgi:hypothetical protein